MSKKSQFLRILFVKDKPGDVELVKPELNKENIDFTSKVVNTALEFKKELAEFNPDIIISDYSMNHFDGMRALEMTRERQPYIPFIILAGPLSEQAVVECMKAGADDYVIKDKITRLPFAINDAVDKARVQKEKDWLQQFLLKLSHLSVSEISLNDSLQAIHQEIKKIMKAVNFYIAFYDQKTKKRSIPYYLDENDNITTGKPVTLTNTLTDYVRKTGKARLVTEKDKKNLKEQENIHLMGPTPTVFIGAPIKESSADKVNAVIALWDYNDEDAYDYGDLNLLEIIASEIGVFIDHKRNQEKLRQSEEKFRKLFNDHAAIKLIIDADNGDIVEANNAAANFYGWSIDELEQMNISQINTYSHDKIKEYLEKAKQGREIKFEFKHRKADGNICDVEVYVSQIKIKDKPFIFSIVHDISEKKAVEERLELLSRSVEQSPIAVEITDPYANLEYVNPAFEKISGYTWDELIGQNPRILQSGKHSKEFYKNLWKTILSGKDWHGELHNKKKSGELYWEKAVISPILKEGKITHFVGVKEDITKKKKIDEELRHAKEKAEESDRLKSAFLSNLSHEIRTPMNGILGFTDFLREPELTSEERDDYIETIQKSGQRLLNTVDDIVEMSKIEAGDVTTDWQEININNSLKHMMQIYVPEAREKGLELKLDQLLPEHHSVIITDKDKYEAILINLIKNAIKYTNKGYINVGANKKNEVVEFYVKDTGIGVPENRQDAIFNRFEQADISDTRAFEGSGLGLAITKSYIELLGGNIWLESQENKGSVFYFTLPAKNIAQSY